MIETKAKVAIFDIDQTFWAADSLRAFMRHFKREKRFKRGFEIRVAWHATTYALGFLNVQALCELILSGVRGMSQTRLREISQEIYRDKLRPHIFHEVVGIFDGYRRNGALTVLAGGAPREIPTTS
jgi:phosphoserine phosphatase